MRSQTFLEASSLIPGWSEGFGSVKLSSRATNALDSDKSVADTVALMGIHAKAASSSQQVREALASAGCLEKGLTEEEVCNRVFSWIKGHISFVEDSEQLQKIFKVDKSRELLITPPALLSMQSPKGDCDDFSMLVCSMLMAKGIACDFVTVAANSNQPKEFSHVYNLARFRDGRSLPIDSSHGRYAGWETGKALRKQVWPVFNWGSDSELGGLEKMKGFTGPAVKQGNSHIHALSGLLGDIGDFWSELGVDPNYGGTQAGTGNGFPNPPVIMPSQPSIWNTILPGIFGSVEKIAIQTTQQPGVQTIGPHGEYSSTVLPQGATNFANLQIPGVSSGSGSWIPILLIGGGLLLAFKAFSK